MNSLQQRNRTLSELLTELKARLSFIAQGPASNNNNPVLLSFLQEGHEFLYDELQPTPSRKRTTITLEPGSVLYDWHNDLEDENIEPSLAQSLWVIIGDNQRIRLTQGITEVDREFDNRQYPTKYDTLNGQIEVWPTPDRNYPLVVEYIASRPRFSQPSDRPGVPDRLILLYAIANAKAHYRHPDAQAAGTTLSNMLRREKAKQHENRRYFANCPDDGEETVMRNGDGYSYQVR